MRVYSGVVVNGMVEVIGALLPEGARVIIHVPHDQMPRDFSGDMLAEIETSITQANRGQLTPLADVLDDLDAIVGGASSK